MYKIIKNICCIGAGYVGGPTMSVIAKNCPYIQVNVVDSNKDRIKQWNSTDLTKLPIFEPGLDKIVGERRGKNLHFSTNIEHEISKADMIFISVNTPTKTKGIGAGKAIDLKWVENCTRQIAKHATGYTIVVEKSTIPVRTAETIKKILTSKDLSLNSKKYNKKVFSVLSNPEFLAEGTAVNDLTNPDRILIGGDNEEAIKSLVEIYSNWIKKEKIITTDLWSSELSKLISNAFLAQRISSINSISALCEATGADIDNVAKAVGRDKRIGQEFLKVGPGFGGSCFKKDILNLVYICDYYGISEVAKYWQQVIEINIWQRNRIVEIIVKKMFGNISEKKLAILGFAFKANTNDTRESPAIEICKRLIEEGANLSIYDPKVPAQRIIEDLDLEKFSNREIGKSEITIEINLIDAIKDSDAIIILTEWEDFKNLDWEDISNKMRSPSYLFDTRSVVEEKEVEQNGINLWKIGSSN